MRHGLIVLALVQLYAMPAPAQNSGGDSQATQEEEALEDLLGDDEDVEFTRPPPPPDARGPNQWETAPDGSSSPGAAADPDRVVTTPGAVDPNAGAPSLEQRHAVRVYVDDTIDARLARVDGRVPVEEIDNHLVYAPSPAAQQNPAIEALERRLWSERLKDYKQAKLAERLLNDLDAPGPDDGGGPADGQSAPPSEPALGTVRLGDPPPATPSEPTSFEKFIARSGVLDAPAPPAESGGEATAVPHTAPRAPTAGHSAPPAAAADVPPRGSASAAVPKPKPALSGPPGDGAPPADRLAAEPAGGANTATPPGAIAAARSDDTASDLPKPATAQPPPPDDFADRFGFARERAALSDGKRDRPASAARSGDRASTAPEAAVTSAENPLQHAELERTAMEKFLADETLSEAEQTAVAAARQAAAGKSADQVDAELADAAELQAAADSIRTEVAAVTAQDDANNQLAYLEPATDAGAPQSRVVQAGNHTVRVVTDDAAAPDRPADPPANQAPPAVDEETGRDTIVLVRPDRAHSARADRDRPPDDRSVESDRVSRELEIRARRQATQARFEKCILFFFCRAREAPASEATAREAPAGAGADFGRD